MNTSTQTPPPLSADQQRLIKAFGQLNHKTQQTVLHLLDGFVDNPKFKARPSLRLVGGGAR